MADTLEIISPCPAEALLHEWVANIRRTTPPDAKAAVSAAQAEIEERVSQVVAKSNVGAAFQLLIAFTDWPWRHSDASDATGIPDEAMESITDGSDFKRRLMMGAYFHLVRNVGDVDLRDAERWLTAENIDGGGIMQWLRYSQSSVTHRELV